MRPCPRLTKEQLKARSQARRLASRQVMKEVLSSPPLRPLKQTLTILSVSTFPKRFEPLRDRLVREAEKHPDFQGLDPDEIVRSVENRLWTVIQTSPWWLGQLKGDKPKRAASPAQLAALAKARQRKQAIQDEADTPYVRCEATMTGEELAEYLRS